MSAFRSLTSHLKEISDFLAEYKAELKSTKFPDTYIIKFSPETKVNQPAVADLRGLIFNVVTKQVYSMTFPVPLEFNLLPLEEQSTVEFPNFPRVNIPFKKPWMGRSYVWPTSTLRRVGCFQPIIRKMLMKLFG